MIFDWVIFSIALIWISAATLFDIKTKEVPDWLSFSLIAIGIFVNLFYSLYEGIYINLLYSFMGFLFCFLFGNLLYVLKQWGGGDTKLLIGIGILIPFYPKTLLNYFNPNLDMPFLLIFIMNLMIVGGIYGLIMAFYYAIINKKKFYKEFLFLFKKNKAFLEIVSPIFILFLFLTLFVEKDYRWMFFLLSALILLLPYLFLLMKAVENSSMYRKVKIKDLREGDWLSGDIKYRKKIIYKPKYYGITKEEIKMLKKYKIKDVIIKEGFAFIPSFFFGFLITIIFGNLISLAYFL